ncbi:MAG: hypothetical protein AAB400_02925 [Patescibacteria group bacterium]
MNIFNLFKTRATEPFSKENAQLFLTKAGIPEGVIHFIHQTSGYNPKISENGVNITIAGDLNNEELKKLAILAVYFPSFEKWQLVSTESPQGIPTGSKRVPCIISYCLKEVFL